MAKDLRSQLKATSINKLKKVVDSDNNMIGASSGEFLSLEDGKAIKIRIFPAHPGNDRFYVSKKSYWLSRLNDEGDTKRFTVLDSTVHGGTKMDVVAEYVKTVKNRFAKNSKIMEAISGEKDSLNPMYTWVAYASKVSGEDELKPVQWEFKKTVRDALNKLAFSEDEDEVIEIDPFTDVDEGIPVMVKYMKNPNRKKGENYYEVSFPKNAKPRPLTDEEIERFVNLKPLEEVINNYSVKEFDRALEGLQLFDETHDINLFEDDEWLEKVEEIKAQYDDEEEEEAPKKKVAKKVVEDDDDEDEDFDAKPKKKIVKKPIVEDDDDEEEVPKKKAVKKVVVEDDEDEEEEAPKKKVSKKVVEDDDDDDNEEEVPKKPKMTLADIKAKLAAKGKK